MVEGRLVILAPVGLDHLMSISAPPSPEPNGIVSGPLLTCQKVINVLGSTVKPPPIVTVQLVEETSASGRNIVIPVSPAGMLMVPWALTFAKPIG